MDIYSHEFALNCDKLVFSFHPLIMNKMIKLYLNPPYVLSISHRRLPPFQEKIHQKQLE